jgi:NAD-dependent malate dehydrogenase
VRVVVTGAAGQIAYSLIPLIGRGELFGAQTPIILHLLDIPYCQESLNGVVIELQDSAFPLVKEIVATTDVKTAFTGVDVAVLVGSFPRKEGMERKDLLEKNISIFREQGKALNDFAKKSVKVLVVGNPANTNCLIAQLSAPDLPPENFSALTRLDHNRALYQLSAKANVPLSSVLRVTIWGNHSKTQYPDASNAVSEGKLLVPIINDEKWIQETFVSVVQNRGAEVLKLRKLSSAASAAKAIVDHLKSWLFGTSAGDWVSMAVVSDGSYGVQKGLVFSYPVTISHTKWTIVPNLTISEFSQKKLNETEQELKEERDIAFEILGIKQ